MRKNTGKAGVRAKTPKGAASGPSFLEARPAATSIAPTDIAATANPNEARTPNASIRLPPTAIPAENPTNTAVVIQANASAAVPRLATASTSP